MRSKIFVSENNFVDNIFILTLKVFLMLSSLSVRNTRRKRGTRRIASTRKYIVNARQNAKGRSVFLLLFFMNIKNNSVVSAANAMNGRSGFASVLDQMNSSGMSENIMAHIGANSFLSVRRLAIMNTDTIEMAPKNSSRLYDAALLVPKRPNAMEIRNGQPEGSKLS